MKIAIINDTHFGARGDSQIFFDYFMRFFDEVFFPYLEEHNIDTIIHAGDLMDRRKFINFNILNQVRTRFMDKLKSKNIKMHCILGNHDVYYRNTNEINSIRELFSNDLTLYEKPEVVNFDGLDIALLPWVNKTNKDQCVEFIKTASAPILIGHLELNGYQVMRGVDFQGGMDKDPFDRYEKVLSGHFHCRQEKENVYYMGTQYQITFSDLHEKKGFHVLDTESRDIEFIENPHMMFYCLTYNDSSGPLDLDSLNFSNMKNAFVKIYIEHKKHPYSFDRYMDKLYEAGVSKITTVDDANNSSWQQEEIVDLAQDTVTLINNEVDQLEEVKDKSKLKKLIKDLYMESLSL
jgi:DNA repair exonuclease SbcCD nuclease subunit